MGAFPVHPLRARAEGALSGCGRAFLRCDRGEGLYVTNAPLDEQRLCALAQAGFRAERQGALWRLFPQEGLLTAAEEWLSGEEEPLRLPALREIEPADWALFCEGVKRLELPFDAPALQRYERRVRQRAAECMRTGRGGGLLTLCSRMLSRGREGLKEFTASKGREI